MSDVKSVASRDDGRIVLYALCQLALVAVLLGVCTWIVPVLATAITLGALAAVAPNAIVALCMQRARANAFVMYAMLRSALVAMTVLGGFLSLGPPAVPYFLGVVMGVVVIAFTPIGLAAVRAAAARVGASA